MEESRVRSAQRYPRLELGQLIAAPFATRLMAEFGAEVIKVEPPGEGDPLRKWRKMHEGTSLWWYLQSRNKKSIAVNLKSPDGLDIVKQLAKSADVVVENFGPAVWKSSGWAGTCSRRSTPTS